MWHHRSFTLIELLVVIAILAILMCILLPALSLARETVYKAVCMNNMRQIGIMLFNYASNYDGHFPRTRTYNGGWSNAYANQAYWPRLLSITELNKDMPTDAAIPIDSMSSSTPFFCPTVTRRIQSYGCSYFRVSTVCTTYGSNFRWSSDHNMNGNSSFIPPANLLRIKRSNFPLLFDCGRETILYNYPLAGVNCFMLTYADRQYDFYSGTGFFASYPGFWHGPGGKNTSSPLAGTTNQLTIDGAVTSISASQIERYRLTSSVTMQMIPYFWDMQTQQNLPP